MKQGNQDLSKIDQIIDRYSGDKEALIQILLDAQAEYNWLSNAVIARVSEQLDIPISSFYFF